MTRITLRLITVVVIAMAAFAQTTRAQAASTQTASAQQAGQATLTGKVTDATGAMIVGATITATATSGSRSRAHREATTAADGTFVMERLPAGTYRVTAHADGFAAPWPQSVTLTADGRQAIAIELQIASLSETVTTVYGAKTGRSILDTPSSVGVIDGARMDASAMFRIEDVFRQMANVNRADWIDSGIVLRGINSEGVGGPSGSPLATTYVDGVPQTQQGTRRGVNGTWDLQQVEVWRGPQSTIVGRNALAGAIQIKSNDPTMKWETAARLGFGTDTFNNQADRRGAAEPSWRDLELFTGIERPVFDASRVAMPKLTPMPMPMPMMSFDELLSRYKARIPDAPPFNMEIDGWGDAAALVTFEGNGDRSLGGSAIATLSAVTGEIVMSRAPDTTPPMAATAAAFGVLHFARFGGQALKALFFVLALAAAAVMPTGNILWIEVRRPRDPRATPWLHRLLARLTSGVGFGLLAAVPAAFLVSRLFRSVGPAA